MGEGRDETLGILSSTLATNSDTVLAFLNTSPNPVDIEFLPPILSKVYDLWEKDEQGRWGALLTPIRDTPAVKATLRPHQTKIWRLVQVDGDFVLLQPANAMLH